MDESARPQTAQKRAGLYFLVSGQLELTADDTRLVTKLTGQPVLDLMFNHNKQEKELFAELNRRTRIAMDKLQENQEDALSAMLDEDDDAIVFSAPFLRRIRQIGNLDSLHVIGSFSNKPGSQFHESGPWTTFVYAQFENWNQYWNLVWNEEETFKENRSGPWPTFVLIPTSDDHYKGVRQVHPWNMINIRFENECIVVGNLHACPEK